jgi:hypothetical protein
MERPARKTKTRKVGGVPGRILGTLCFDGPTNPYLHKNTTGTMNLKMLYSLLSSLDEGWWSTPLPGRFTPGKDPVPIVLEVGWDPGPVCTGAENVAPDRHSILGPSSP